MPSSLSRNQQSVMILGASSWLGYLLIEQLKMLEDYMLLGSYYQHKLTFGDKVQLFFADDAANYTLLLAKHKPTVVVNFLRGEDDNGMAIHKNIISYCTTTNTHYIYASSVLALDAYKDIELTENLVPKSLSIYGIFKAKCEQLLLESSINWACLRFASVQGWVPHKLTRNEAFLKNISAGKTITVDRGVMQNRLMADLLVEGIVEIIKKQLIGVFHFGTTDASEEFHYLRKVATIFGHPKELVKTGAEREVNLVAIPSRIFTDLDLDLRQTEADTLEKLLAIPALQKYRIIEAKLK